MEDFFIQGCRIENQGKHELKLPAARKYKIITPRGEADILEPAKLIRHAVQMRKQSRHKRGLSSPVVIRGYEPVDMYNSYDKILARHPFPFFQGPLIVELDKSLNMVKKGRENVNRRTDITDISDSEIQAAKTIFVHSTSQECGKWNPLKCGLQGWGNIAGSASEILSESKPYKVSRQDDTHLEGPASSRKNMSLLFICQLHQCVIECPCSICMNVTEKKSCSYQCRTKCIECRYQCLEHELKLPWTFNEQTDQFTMVTSEADYFHFATPYAGIPTDCQSCSNDVAEHQILHLVVHINCKFCCQEFRPFDKEIIVTMNDFIRAENKMIYTEERTCSICFNRCPDKKSRKRHEVKAHLIQTSKTHQCQICDKRYSNKNALKYHCSTKHKDNTDIPKDDKVEDKETREAEFGCEDCNKQFLSEKSKWRHQREVHRYTIKFLDYAPEDSEQFQCSECSSTFLRKAYLRQHQDNVHGEKRKIICPSCGTEFSWKDNLTRHLKKQICTI